MKYDRCVLFTCFQYPELNPMIMRRFQEPGDVERAFELVHKSQGLEQTQFLARKHCLEAVRHANELADSPYQKGLQVVSNLVINRMKWQLPHLYILLYIIFFVSNVSDLILVESNLNVFLAECDLVRLETLKSFWF